MKTGKMLIAALALSVFGAIFGGVTRSFMTVATGAVIYWTILGLVEMPIKGIIIAAIYGE